MPRIRIDLTATGTLKVTPESYLGGNEFKSYVSACRSAGALYSPSLRAQVGEKAIIVALTQALAAASFDVTIDQRIVSAVEEQAASIEQQRATARAIADEASKRLDAMLEGRDLTLYPFQTDGVRWLAPRTAAVLADQMGLGKTVQALMALPANAAVVVVCPASVKRVWQREARRWRPEYFPQILKGRDSFRWPRPGQMLITNYDILPKAVLRSTGDEPVPRARVKLGDLRASAQTNPFPGTVVIADEAHALKTKGTKRTRRFQVLSHETREAQGRVWLLTGTPLLNRPDELWNVFTAAGLAEEAFGTWRRFCQLFGWWGGNTARPTPELPAVLRRVMLNRRREEVLPDLPTKTYETVPVDDLAPEVVTLCDELVKRLADAGIDLTRADEVIDLVKIMTLDFQFISKVRAALATAKIPALLELVEQFEEQGEPLVVFSAHVAPAETVGKRPGWALITGGTSLDERARIVDDFQAGKLKGIGITIKAGGVGLTLTRAHIALFCDLEWTPALNAQAEDRICRIGQDRGVIVQRLVATHVLDERMTEVLHRKQCLIEQSVEAAAVQNVADLPGLEPVAPLPAYQTHDAAATPNERQGLGGSSSSPLRPGRRAAANATEEWAQRGLAALSAMDPDHASVINGVGFSKLDGDFGRSLSEQLQSGFGLSDKQWTHAVRLATRYRRQVGAPPSTDAI